MTQPTTPLEILIAARQWLDDPAHWAKRTMWRDGEGRDTEERFGVRSTCAAGALYFVAGCDAPITYGANGNVALSASTMLASFVPYEDISGFNDAPITTHADVLALFDRAIEAAKKDPCLSGYHP